MMDYVPAWIKADPVRFAHVLNSHGERVKVLSPNSKTNMEADRQAFMTAARPGPAVRPPHL
jgi:hypothetical protein